MLSFQSLTVNKKRNNPMKYLIAAFFLIVNFSHSNAQNLVINPSFEIPKIINKNIKIGKADTLEKLVGWTSSTKNTVLAYKADIQGNIIDNEFPGDRNFKAQNGENVVAIKVFGKRYNAETGHDEENRSYISGELSHPLKIGQKYYIGFSVHFHCIATNKVGFIFTKERIKKNTAILNLKPMMYQKTVNNFDPNKTWTVVSDSFVADNNYKNFVIGNFVRNDSTLTGDNREGVHYLAYIDNVFVFEGNNNPIPKNKPLITLPKSFNNVNFQNNSAIFDAKAYMILDSITEIMVRYPQISIYVKGHTSMKGDKNYNQKLSELRAYAITNYLIKKGIQPKRLKAKGFGATQPLVPENSEENERTNRRIEFEVNELIE